MLSGTCSGVAFSSWRQRTSGRSRSIRSRTCSCRARMPLTFQVTTFMGVAPERRIAAPASPALEDRLPLLLERLRPLAAIFGHRDRDAELHLALERLLGGQ